ncbi:MAG: hypothetical protein KJ709_09385 [Nanoarchaeota archaeon]|nr:hypothetical protein [Nanoarchaeota archaeon]
MVTLSELGEDDLEQVRARVKAIGSSDLPDITKNQAGLLEEKLTLEMLQNPAWLLNTFLNAHYRDCIKAGEGPRRPSYGVFVDSMPQLAEWLMPGEFAEAVNEWHSDHAKSFKENYHRWYCDIYDRDPGKPHGM